MHAPRATSRVEAKPTPSITMSNSALVPRWSIASAVWPQRSLRKARRAGFGSMIVTSATPCAFRLSAAPRPMAPPPRTSDRIPAAGRSIAARPSRTACQPQAMGSARAALSAATPSGTVTRLHAGMATHSANAPSRGGIEMIWRSAQRFSRPDRQAAQAPQVTRGFIVTRSPSRAPPGDHPGRLVPEHQGRGATLVMAEEGVHVRPADTYPLNADQFLALGGDGVGHVAIVEAFGAGIDKRLHFAVNPPSTIRTCPVT